MSDKTDLRKSMKDKPPIAGDMPKIPPNVLAKMKRLRRRRFVMKWLQKLPWLKP